MEEKISALMDGELGADDAASAIARFRKADELREQWAVYHLISDVLAQPEVLPVDVTLRVNARLATEPTVLAPRPSSSSSGRHKPIAFAAAASIAAMAVAGWMSVHTTPPVDRLQANLADNRPSPAVPLPAIPAASVSTPPPIPASVPAQINDYLMAHREFSPGAAMHGMAPSYIRTVAESRQNFAR
jgi:sigma-E factor negative regulatory protein RseA